MDRPAARRENFFRLPMSCGGTVVLSQALQLSRRRPVRGSRREVLMDWKKLADRAKQMINQRGGTESVKEDAQELRNIARREGPAEDKIKAAAEALREP